jgi:hypothetical protein
MPRGRALRGSLGAACAGVSRAELLRRFGRALFRLVTALYPAFLAGAEPALAFLAAIDTCVHGELQKLYPMPSFPCSSAGGWMTAGWR